MILGTPLTHVRTVAGVAAVDLKDLTAAYHRDQSMPVPR